MTTPAPMASTGALADAKSRRRAHGDAVAAQRRRWIRRASYYHADLVRYLRSIVPPGSRVLDVGCGTGAVLASLEPSRGLGIDLSPEMVRVARAEHPADRFPHLEFRVGDAEALELGETFDHVVLSNVIGELVDVWAAFRALRRACHPSTRAASA